MGNIFKNLTKKLPRHSPTFNASATDDILSHLAFDNAAQANIITIVSTGKIIMANSAASKLLGYSKKELLTKSRSAIFNINETRFKKMLEQRTSEGQSASLVTAIKKNGISITCQITSAVFTDANGIENAITTITDMSRSILLQKNIDSKNKKTVAGDIALAKSKQKKIDVIRVKKVTDDIALAKSKQKKIDIEKDKLVAANIILAQAKSDARLLENNQWIKYIAKTSYDVMWDWDIVSGEIYTGDSVKEVFGYRVQNNKITFTDFCQYLLPEEKNVVEKKIFDALASGSKAWNDAFMFKRRNGSVASTISRASIVRDDAGKPIHMIGAIQDVSRLQQLEKNLEEQIIIQQEDSEKFMLAARLSFDVIWDWNLLTNEVFLGDGFEELFGYNIKNNTGDMFTDWVNYIHPDDREHVKTDMFSRIKSTETQWECGYRVSRADGSIARVYVRANILRNANGKAYRVIGAMQDLSRQKELEEKLEEANTAKGEQLTAYKESFNLIINSSTDVLFDSDLTKNEVIISDAYEKVFGHKIINNTMERNGCINHIHPDDKETVKNEYERILASGAVKWEYRYRFLRADNSVANVVSNCVILRHTNGVAYRIIGALHDTGKQKALEERIEQEIKLKELQIKEAAADAKEAERSEIGKELHDNINQLLSASIMYLQMAKQGGENSALYLSRSSEYTTTAVDEIRKLTKGLSTDIIKNLGLGDAIDNISRDTMEVNPIKISCSIASFKEDSVNEKFKLNVFRIVQEQLNNILKHAKATKVKIGLVQNKRSIRLTISDNGVGFDTGKKQKGIGIPNIKSRVTSFNGTVNFVSQPGQGCVVTVIFPFSDAVKPG